MKKIYNVIAFVALMTLAGHSVKAEKFSFPDSWGKQGFTLIDDNKSQVIINYSLTDFYLQDLEIDGEQLKTVKAPGIFLPNNEGSPDLPGSGKFIAIPQGAIASYEIVSIRTEMLTNIEIAPAPRIPFDTDNGPLHYEKDTKIYAKNAYYPAEYISLKNYTLRGMDAVMLGITPFQYNPVTKELLVIRDIKIKINISGGNGLIGDERLRSRWWDPIIKDAVLNPEAIPEIDYNKKPSYSKTPDYEYLIISPDDPVFLAWADSIKVFRTLQGIKTGVVTTTDIGGNTTTAIENYVNNAYNNWDFPPVAVLLLGDYGTSGNTIISPMWNSYCVSDNIYADVDNDDLPDIVFARMTAQNETHLETMITKFLNNERNPPTNPDFYNNPITAMGYQSDRWFQICSETINGFWEYELGKEPVRENAGYTNGSAPSTWSTNANTSMVLDYFGPSGLGYIPATPAHLTDWGANATRLNNDINSGAFMLQHRDHGGTTGWSHPSYYSSDIDNLYNTDLVWVFSINCLTGKYNISGECFTEKFHRYTHNGQNSGALGVTAASEVSYSFVNDTYVWGLYDNMWPDFMPDETSVNPEPRGVLPAFGNAAAKHFLEASSWPYNPQHKVYTHHLFHHHGDAFTTVYTEIPQYLTVTHNAALISGATSFTVTADNESFIALTVNGEIIGTAEGTGSPVIITIPPQMPGNVMIVTVTKQNFYRYSSSVNIIPPSGPFVAYHSHTINDATGNGNGQADYGENISLNMTVENQGSVTAYNVNATLISSDPYITITDNSETFGTINSGATSTQNDAFTLTIADDIPDQYSIDFELEVNGNADDTWTSYFTIVVNAPVLETGSMLISDAVGGNGNGKLDPGETADIIIETSNTGNSDSPVANGTLLCSSPYITINSGSFDFGPIPMGATENATFIVSVDASAPIGTSVNFDYDVVAGNYSATDSYYEVIGQIPVLILDLDDNTSSGPAMGIAMTNLGVPYDYATSFPTDINLYSSVFVCLGIYSSNHVLSSAEGQDLAVYLNGGGLLYMEGGDTWYYDPSTPVHSMFNINDVADGTSDMGTVLGQAGTFTEGMTFNYIGENNWMDHINPIAPAVQIFMNQSPSYGCGVAYDAGTYKTIGTSYEFGGLTDGASPSTKTELMYEYLKFFGITGTSVNLTAFLEGPFVTTEMITALNSSGHLPLTQPYNVSPWNYSGGETVASIPNANVVDWVLIELRETPGDASSAIPSTMLNIKAGFILKNGSVVDLDGSSPLEFDISVTENLFAIVYHRNHLGIMSAYPLTLLGHVYSYNFTSNMGTVFGEQNGHCEIAPGIWGMMAGDGNGDGEVDNKDKNDIWKIQMGSTGYLNGDFDMNGQVETVDKSLLWKINAGNSSFIIE